MSAGKNEELVPFRRPRSPLGQTATTTVSKKKPILPRATHEEILEQKTQHRILLEQELAYVTSIINNPLLYKEFTNNNSILTKDLLDNILTIEGQQGRSHAHLLRKNHKLVENLITQEPIIELSDEAKVALNTLSIYYNIVDSKQAEVDLLKPQRSRA